MINHSNVGEVRVKDVNNVEVGIEILKDVSNGINTVNYTKNEDLSDVMKSTDVIKIEPVETLNIKKC